MGEVAIESLDIARLAVVGGGRMGEAIIGGLLSAGALDGSRIVVVEPDAERREALTTRHGVSAQAAYSEMTPAADVVLLAVKPQILDTVVRDISPMIGGALVVSIAAGVSCARIESLLPAGAAVVRVMPNTPALVGCGMALVSGGTEASAEHVGLVRDMFAAVGEVAMLEERYQDAGTAVSGSGPAYFALVIDALARAGVAQGLPRATAERLAVQTMLGTATMLLETGMHPESLIDGVASPGGTTIAAIERLEARGVRAAFAEAVSAAAKRSRELGS